MVTVDYQSIAYNCPLSMCWCEQLKKFDGKEVNGLELIALYYRIVNSHKKFDGYPYYDEIALRIVDISKNDQYNKLNIINIIEIMAKWLNDFPFCYTIMAPAVIDLLTLYTTKFGKNDKIIFDLYNKLMVLFKQKKYLNSYYYTAKQVIITNNLVDEFVAHVEAAARAQAKFDNSSTPVKIIGSKNIDKIHYTVADFYADLPDDWRLGVLL